MNIVLAHGILGFDKALGIHYFNGIKEHLESKFQVRILTPKVDPVKGIKYRGRQLAKQILEALGKTGRHPEVLDADQKVHIIAHSMGGLDSRFILSPQANQEDNIAAFVASLTTIGTPHQGTPVADFYYSLVDGGKREAPLETAENKIKSSFERFGLSFDGLEDLTTWKMLAFNQSYEDHPAVKYFCIAGRGRDIALKPSLGFNLTKTCAVLLPSHGYIKLKIGEDSDGLTPVSSALRPGWVKLGTWPADHFEEVGHNVDLGPTGRPAHFDYLNQYEKIVEYLRTLE